MMTTKEGALLTVFVMLVAAMALSAFGLSAAHLAHEIGHALDNVTLTGAGQ